MESTNDLVPTSNAADMDLRAKKSAASRKKKDRKMKAQRRTW